MSNRPPPPLVPRRADERQGAFGFVETPSAPPVRPAAPVPQAASPALPATPTSPALPAAPTSPALPATQSNPALPTRPASPALPAPGAEPVAATRPAPPWAPRQPGRPGAAVPGPTGGTGGAGAPPPPSGPALLQVSEIVGRAARLLDDHFSDVWVEGEIEGFKRHHVSGNCYFALKDASARIECMLRKSSHDRIKTPLRDGLKVRARGRVTIYREQGRFQFYIEELELSGEGELLQRFEEMKARLAKEGLFDAARKRKLPPFPRTIGVATSSSGAALQDILKVAARRGRVNILVANCAVQGPQAPPQIAAAIERLAPHVDVLIVGRGGGSVADLWCFNDELVARAIYRCPVPVVSAVGHEVDFTISDFVADVRAPTPSAAAELCVPHFGQLSGELQHLSQRLLRAGRRAIDTARQRLDAELGRGQLVLERQLAQRRRLLGQLSERMQAQHPRARLLRDRTTLRELEQRLQGGLVPRLLRGRDETADLRQRLDEAVRRQLELRRRGVETLMGKLDALSPLRVLQRGYAVARDHEGRVLTEARGVTPGTAFRLLLSQGALDCRVERRVPEPGEAPAAAPEATPEGTAEAAPGATAAPVPSKPRGRARKKSEGA
ncbi:MAG: exodeoxyribonuclease VII large subunit [Polyangia bacterium]